MTIKTFGDLKNFLNAFSEEQLKERAVLQVIDSGVEFIESGQFTEEDDYLTDEGWAPISTFEPEDDNDKLENYEIRKSGYPLLFNE